jgi:hypothetical protein
MATSIAGQVIGYDYSSDISNQLGPPIRQGSTQSTEIQRHQTAAQR